MSDRPNPINNPALNGYDILATSPEVRGPWRDTISRALVVRYADHRNKVAHIIWQEKSKDSDEWRYQPGSNASNCEAVIIALMSTK